MFWMDSYCSCSNPGAEKLWGIFPFFFSLRKPASTSFVYLDSLHKAFGGSEPC